MTRSISGSESYYFDEKAANLAVDFFRRYLVHVKGEWAGSPLALAEWQAERIVRPLYGWRRGSDDLRKFRTVYVQVPRKNGKSTLAAGIAIRSFTADHEPGAEVYSAAADREQANIVFSVAQSMVELSPALASRCEVYKRSIVFPQTLSSYKVISSDAGTKHGFNTHCTVFDELHAWRGRELYDVLTTAQGSRRQPINFQITTPGFDQTSICYQEYQYAKKVADGIVRDPTYLPVIFEPPTGADWADEAVWAEVNPNLGTSVKVDYLREKFRKARESLALQNTFRRLHLGEWTSQETRWLDMGVWKENAIEIDLEDLAGRPCYGGLDLSATTDLSAFVLCFPLENGWYILLPWYWIPEATLVARAQRDRVPFRDWVSDGWLDTTDGEVVDYERIREEINLAGRCYDVKQIGFDPWNATDLVTRLAGDGFDMVQFRQGFASLSAPSKEFERLLLERRLKHPGDPVLDWMASNVEVKVDPAGNIKPVKPNRKTSPHRIDGIVAAVIALGLTVSQENTSSVYADRGLMIL